MGLIIKDRLQMLLKGYPTVSDKYNVSGGILAGSTAVKFGDLVKRSGTPGYFEAITDTVSLADICGFVLATNVKLAENWPGTTVQVNPGEAFNLMINGFIAIELDAGASIVTAAAVAAVGKATTDTSVVEGKTYYTRESSAAGAGYLNDGEYAYTAVVGPTGDPQAQGYYELTSVGSDASTNYAIPNAQVAVILANGHLTTPDKIDDSTIVALPGCVFTGIVEVQGTAKLAEIYVK